MWYKWFSFRGSISVLWGASIFYPRPNFKAYYLRQIFSGLIGLCDADDKLCIKEFWRQFNIKMAIVIRFPFYAFSIYAAICRIAPPCIMRVTCVLISTPPCKLHSQPVLSSFTCRWYSNNCDVRS
jgi:hypothetical protein